MKITNELLQQRCGYKQPKFSTHIDLSHCNIVSLDGLKGCHRVQTLILRHNSIPAITNVVSQCKDLWKLDISHNVVCSLDGFLKLRCVGTLVLSFNDLTWSELRKLQHLIIMDLRLIGNPRLETDPYYRRHIIDCLPHVWMLDGILVTAAEREQVRKFFQNSEILDRPVRHKLRAVTASRYVPSHIQKLSNQAVLGRRAVKMLHSFSQTEKQTLHTDYRRIKYIAQCIEQDLELQQMYWSQLQTLGQEAPITSSPIPAYISNIHIVEEDRHKAYTDKSSVVTVPDPHVPPLHDLICLRTEHTEQSNMLLLLLVAGLEFSLPLTLLQETLRTASLANIGGVDCNALLELPHDQLLFTCSLLLSSVIIDRGEGEHGGLYHRLYVSLYVILSNILRTTHGSPDTYQLKYMSPAIHRALLAAEVVQLMCLVPSFIDLIDRDQGVLDVVAIATQNPHIKDIIADVLWNSDNGDAVDEPHIGRFDYEHPQMSSTLLHFVRMSIQHSSRDPDTNLEQGLVPYHLPLSAVSIPTNANINKRAKSGVAARRLRAQSPAHHMKVPELGDTVSLPRQRKGRIIGLHQDQLALIQISGHPVAPIKEACGAYVYVDMQFMCYNHNTGTWQQQEHVQEYPVESRVEDKCYSVITSTDYNKWQYKDQENHSTDIGDAYYVHENRQLQLEVDEDVHTYMDQRPVLPNTPGLTGVFAPEEDVQIKIVPQREKAVVVMKDLLDSSIDYPSPGRQHRPPSANPTTPLYNPPSAPPLYNSSSTTPLLKHRDTNIKSGPDPDMMQPSSNIKILPINPTKNELYTEPRIAKSSKSRAVSPSLDQWRVGSSFSSSRSRSAVGRSSSSRPVSRVMSRATAPNPNHTDDTNYMFDRHKSLPDVSGISMFAYSMGGKGIIKPPDITDHLATYKPPTKNSASQKKPSLTRVNPVRLR